MVSERLKRDMISELEIANTVILPQQVLFFSASALVYAKWVLLPAQALVELSDTWLLLWYGLLFLKFCVVYWEGFLVFPLNLLYITCFHISLHRGIPVPLSCLGFWSLRSNKYLVSHLGLVKRHSLFCELVSFLIHCALWTNSVGWPLVGGYQTYASHHL